MQQGESASDGGGNDIDLPARLAYFVVPLPTALRIDDGYIFQFLGPESPTFEHLRDLHARGLHHEDVQYVPDLVASLRFRQVIESPPHQAALIYRLMDVFWQAIPGERPAPEPSSDLAESPTGRVTVVEMVIPLPERLDLPDALSDAFDAGLDAIQRFQRAYALATGEPVQLVTLENLPMMVPFGMRVVDVDKDEWPDAPSLFFTNRNIHAVEEPSISKDEWDALQLGLELEGFHPLFGASDLAREAQVAYRKAGDYRVAVILAETAAELFLDSVLTMLLWEESEDYPEDVARKYFPASRSITSRAAADFHGRIGGSWNVRGTGPVAAWIRDLAKLRHRVIHGGHRPTREETALAFDAFHGLQRFVQERLADPHVLSRYPRTAMHVVSRPALQRQGLWSKRLEALGRNPSEPPWLPTFERFLWVVNDERLRQSDAALVPVSKPEDWNAVLVVAADDSEEGWFLHDVERRLACQAKEPPDLTDGFHADVRRARDKNQALAVPVRLSLPGIGISTDVLPGSGWIRDYHVLPNVGVMLRVPGAANHHSQ